jgi:hypothetical protein
MNPIAAQTIKIEAHASHLLDEFIKLREKYALLAPMLFSEDVVRARGSHKQSRGFKILRQSLFLSCAQDIGKLCFDKHPTTPSIHNLMEALEDKLLRASLEEKFAACIAPSIDEESDPEVLQALAVFEAHESDQQRAQFIQLYAESVEKWQALSASSVTKGFLTIRDKVSAHTELKFLVDKYKLVDIGGLGIKWRDIAGTLDVMQRLVEILGLLVRNAGFAWDSLDAHLSMAARDFWET